MRIKITKPKLQSAALAYRVEPNGRTRVLLVTKKHSRKWGVPKGSAKPYLSLAENAAKEAFEEAGVIGEVTPGSAGMFRARKKTTFGEQIIEVWVYAMLVTDCLDEWPEKAQRQTKWVSCRTAARTLNEPVLKGLCRKLERR